MSSLFPPPPCAASCPLKTFRRSAKQLRRGLCLRAPTPVAGIALTGQGRRPEGSAGIADQGANFPPSGSAKLAVPRDLRADLLLPSTQRGYLRCGSGVRKGGGWRGGWAVIQGRVSGGSRHILTSHRKKHQPASTCWASGVPMIYLEMKSYARLACLACLDGRCRSAGPLWLMLYCLLLLTLALS